VCGEEYLHQRGMKLAEKTALWDCFMTCRATAHQGNWQLQFPRKIPNFKQAHTEERCLIRCSHHLEWVRCLPAHFLHFFKSSIVLHNVRIQEGQFCKGFENYAVNESSHILNDDNSGRKRLSGA
jgi:hypothetical protein